MGIGARISMDSGFSPYDSILPYCYKISNVKIRLIINYRSEFLTVFLKLLTLHLFILYFQFIIITCYNLRVWNFTIGVYSNDLP